MTYLTRRTLLLGATALLVGCASDPAPRAHLPRVTFAHRPPINFNVAKIDVVNSFRSTGQAPHIEHQVPIAPAAVARQWAQDRLVAKGNVGLLRYEIMDASIRAVPLKVDKSLGNALKALADTRYEGRIEVRLRVNAPGGTGDAVAVVTRTRTALENLTLNERDELLIQFVEELGRDLDRRLEAEISQHLSGFLI